MTKKSDNEDMKNTNDVTGPEMDTKRKRLLARVAGHVAGGILVSPSPKVSSSETIAQVAVDVAEAILRRAGL